MGACEAISALGISVGVLALVFFVLGLGIGAGAVLLGVARAVKERGDE